MGVGEGAANRPDLKNEQENHGGDNCGPRGGFKVAFHARHLLARIFFFAIFPAGLGGSPEVGFARNQIEMDIHVARRQREHAHYYWPAAIGPNPIEIARFLSPKNRKLGGLTRCRAGDFRWPARGGHYVYPTVPAPYEGLREGRLARGCRPELIHLVYDQQDIAARVDRFACPCDVRGERLRREFIRHKGKAPRGRGHAARGFARGRDVWALEIYPVRIDDERPFGPATEPGECRFPRTRLP